MKQRHGEGVLVLALVAALFACADSAARTVAPVASPDIAASEISGGQSEERAALTKIARLVAMALNNEPARQHLKRDLRAAPFREHKVELAPYLRSNDGKTLLAGMTAANGGDEGAVFAALAALRRMEFYMPVSSQRETWTGKADVLVASQLEERTPIVAFNESGAQVAVEAKTAPTQPTLSIVPIETRFDQPMDLRRSRNLRDQNGQAIGTLEPSELRQSSLISCGDVCGGGGGGGGGSDPIAPGLYLEFSRILDAKEPWIRGDPEIEVHIHGPTSTSAPTYGENLSCSGEHAPDYRKVFNQDGAFWEGRVLLFSNDETIAYVNKFKEGFHVIFWEDDNEPCTLKYDSNSLVSLLQSTAGAAGTVAVKLIPGAPWYVVGGLFIAQVFSNAGSWLLTNDDFLGVAVDQRQLGSPYPTNTHVIMDGTTLNGRATIVYR
ncbi:MAG TPA: hypothetical protein VJ852_11120 [Gemmatimonadaceae bacterium]|nr:hypothetical protein [Gemmatimonadaceae bacterium]